MVGAPKSAARDGKPRDDADTLAALIISVLFVWLVGLFPCQRPNPLRVSIPPNLVVGAERREAHGRQSIFSAAQKMSQSDPN
jgi:hypothetical protein